MTDDHGSTPLRIAVVDGQGGGIGKAIVERLRRAFGDQVYLLALGTNAMATTQMLKAGADDGATGENAICCNANRVQVITGPVGIVVADAMLGELTAKMAAAIARSNAQKLLIPLNRCNLKIVGIAAQGASLPLQEVVNEVAKIQNQRIAQQAF